MRSAWGGWLVALALVGSWPGSMAGQGSAGPKGGQSGSKPAPEPRNPGHLRASQVLGQTVATSPRVRFEWGSVGGARAYLLVGSITDPRTWRVAATEHRVSVANAAEWTAERVVFETPLNPGLYAWRVVALFPPNDTADFATPAMISFAVH